MAFLRCPHCNAPLTETEASADVCPDCGRPLPNALPKASATQPAAKDSRPGPAQTDWGIDRILLVAGLAVIVILCGLFVARLARTQDDPDEIAELRDANDAAQEQLRTTQTQLTTLGQEKAGLEARLKSAAKALAEAEARRQALQEDAAAAQERIVALEKGMKETQAKLEALQARAAPANLGVFPELKNPPDGAVRTIAIDRLDRDFRLPTFNNGTIAKLVGRVRLLRLEHIENAVVDAGELEADTIFLTGGITNKAKVRLRAKDSLTVPFIDGGAQVELISSEGKVSVGRINGEAKVKVSAHDFTLKEYLDGNDTTVTATLNVHANAAGRLRFHDLRGRTHMFWKKARLTDPDVQVEKGTVRSTAELRELMADR